MKPGNIQKFVQELKRRRVFRGIVVYGASTLVLLEAADIIAGAFGIDGAPQWFVWLLGIGFIGSLIFSWIYDITPGGIRKTEPAKEYPVHIPEREVRLYKTTTFISVMVIIGLLTFNLIDGFTSRKIREIEKTIAVIPVDTKDLRYDDAQHFAFVGEQITACLLEVKDCRVRSWEYCRNYRRGTKSYSEIGKDLSAALLVELSPYETDLERNLFVKLILSSNGNLLMSRSFPINGTWSEEVCRHSREISKRIAKKLRIFLTREERASIDRQKFSARAKWFASLGKNMAQDAINMVQMGNTDGGPEKSEYVDSISFDRAISYFTEAIEEEPEFAEAYANRAKARLWGMTAGFYSRNVLEDCRKDIEKAFELDENLPEAHVSMGFYHFLVQGDYEEALKSFEKAIEKRPDDNEYLFYISRIHSSLGNWDEVQNLADKVFESNPRNALFLTNLGITYLFLGDFIRAIECQNRAIECIPEWFGAYINKAFSFIIMGRIPEARAVIAEVQQKTGKNYFRILAELDLLEEDYSSAVENIDQAEPQEFIDYGESEGEVNLLKAKIYRHARRPIIARGYYEEAEKFYTNRVQFNTTDYFALSKLGVAYAALGKDQQAMECGQKAIGMARQEDIYSATRFPDCLYDMAQTYVLTGDSESALLTIKELLNTHSLYTYDYLKLDPDMKHLLNDPGIDLSNP
jgi:tetratricopeptide (TPR) repeat protein